MIIDEKGKLFGKINILDIVIVLVVIVAIGGLYLKFFKSKTATQTTGGNGITVVFTVDEVPAYVAPAIELGTQVKDRTTGAYFGTVTKVDAGPSVAYAADADGKFVKSTKDGYNALVMVVDGSGSFTKNGVTFGGTDFFVNRQCELKVGNTTFYAKIKSMEPKK